MTYIIERQGAVLAIYDAEYSAPAPKNTPKRGDVTSFSRKSRRRMLLLMNRLDLTGRWTFLTLTFHTSPTVSASNVAFKKFYKRLRRKYPEVSGVWRREFQPQRGAIHFHLLLHNLPYWPQRDIQTTWEACTGEDRSIVHVKLVSGRKHVMAYVSKYVAKLPEDAGTTSLDVSPYQSAEGKPSIGRCWGWINAEALPFAPCERIAVVDDDVTGSIWNLAFLLTNGRCGHDAHIAILFRDDLAEWMALIKRKAKVHAPLSPERGRICRNETLSQLAA